MPASAPRGVVILVHGGAGWPATYSAGLQARNYGDFSRTGDPLLGPLLSGVWHLGVCVGVPLA